MYIPLSTYNRSPRIVYGSITLKKNFVASFDHIKSAVPTENRNFKKSVFRDTLLFILVSLVILVNVAILVNLVSLGK